MSKSVLLKIWISVMSSGYKLCYGGLSNTPKPLRIVKGSWRIVKPEVDSRLSGVVILEVWETISYDMETHTRSQFARDLKNIPHGGWKCCRIASNRQHLLHCILTIDFRSFHALRTWKVHVGMFSYHATHFYTLLTCAPLDFRYVNARFDFRHTMVISHIVYASRTPVC